MLHLQCSSALQERNSIPLLFSLLIGQTWKEPFREGSYWDPGNLGLGANYKTYLWKPATQYLETLIHMERFSWKKKITSTLASCVRCSPSHWKTGGPGPMGWFPRKIERTPQIIFCLILFITTKHAIRDHQRNCLFFPLSNFGDGFALFIFWFMTYIYKYLYHFLCNKYYKIKVKFLKTSSIIEKGPYFLLMYCEALREWKCTLWSKN